MYYINLGGIKLLWGTTAAVGTGTFTITNPTGFFSTIQSASINATGSYVNTNVMTANFTSPLSGMATTISFSPQIITGSGPSNPYSFIVIGT